jgi:hypothetical protein
MVSSWELCIICQISCDDTLSNASEKGKCTLFKAVGLRKDDVHRRLHDEFDSLDLIPTDSIERVFTQLDSDVLTEPQAEAFVCASTGSKFSKFILLVYLL